MRLGIYEIIIISIICCMLIMPFVVGSIAVIAAIVLNKSDMLLLNRFNPLLLLWNACQVLVLSPLHGWRSIFCVQPKMSLRICPIALANLKQILRSARNVSISPKQAANYAKYASHQSAMDRWYALSKKRWMSLHWNAQAVIRENTMSCREFYLPLRALARTI